jgi:hypothetical protein
MVYKQCPSLTPIPPTTWLSIFKDSRHQDDQAVNGGCGAARRGGLFVMNSCQASVDSPNPAAVHALSCATGSLSSRGLHTAKRFKDAALVDNGKNERVAHLIGKPLGGLNETMR